MWFEDIVLDEKKDLGCFTFTEDAIIAFGRKYDPQPFHVDPQAAKESLYGGLIASGWHTASVWMKLAIESRQNESKSESQSSGALARSGVSPGFENMRWLKPVRPGMTLRYSMTPIEKVDLKSRPELGLIKTLGEAHDEAGTLVFRFVGKGFVARKPKGSMA
ncbi:MAG TPA: MaoC family dehydratase [Rhizomicrobium sp.]